MTRLVWDEPGKRLYETGIDRGVFYPNGGVGVPWNGLIAVSEAPSGADITKNHYDGQLFRQQRQSESFAARIRAYSYPREFEEYDGYAPIGHTTQVRKMFGLTYRTKVGSDLDPDSSYLIHLVYNAVVSPAARNFSSLGGAINPTPFEWDLNTIPEILPTGEFSAHIIVNPAIAYPWAVAAFEDIIYGSPTSNARLPSITEVVNLFENASILRITDNHDGTWTADGPEDAITITTSDWYEKRRNLFRDPLTKTIDSTSWGSTDGLRTVLVDGDGTYWVRFTRQTSGNIRLADLKAGPALLRDREYRFVFKLRSSISRIVNLSVRTAVSNGAEGNTSAGSVSLEAGEVHMVDVVARMPNTYESTLGGLTIIHNGTTIGDSLDVSMVNIEDVETARNRIVHGDLDSKSYSRYRWLSTPNASVSVYEERDETFEITWPSAVYIDTNTYRISSL